ncbi:hypothetical protein BJ958_002640 [Nocardioides kongjuensis]|uniref:Uncharacterized protein n=1 Tax=Nocardioides kongjuensis TaxID=349522 RepID=A0A852RT60_9ACTN|nr:hypothetical protein [Nocardioides kongjuensis]
MSTETTPTQRSDISPILYRKLVLRVLLLVGEASSTA